MGLEFFDQTRKEENTFYGEAVRLSNELRAKPAQTIIDKFGNRLDIPFKDGFDIETCDLSKINSWLNDFRIKKSESLVMFVFRVVSIRFPSEFADLKANAHPLLRNELEMVESEAKKEIEWVGQVGFQNMVRLDGTLTNEKVTTMTLANEKIRTVKK